MASCEPPWGPRTAAPRPPPGGYESRWPSPPRPAALDPDPYDPDPYDPGPYDPDGTTRAAPARPRAERPSLMTDVYPLPPPPLRPPSAAGHPRSGPQPSARAAGGPVPRHLQLAALADPRLRAAVAEVLAQVASRLHDGVGEPEAAAVIRDAVRLWSERQIRGGGLVPSPGDREALARAVYDQRYGLGPLAPYLRDPDVENVDVNGCDQVWITYSTGERVAGPPVAASDEDLQSMIRTWAARGGQTSRDFSAATPLVNVALTGGARLTATMSVTPRPCLSLRRHGHLDASLARLVQLGTIDQVLAAFLAAAVRSRCNIIVTGGVNAGKTTMLRALASEIPPGERLATLESEYELYLHGTAQHPDVIAFEARDANSEGPAASPCTTCSPTRCGTTPSGSWSARSAAGRSCRCSRP